MKTTKLKFYGSDQVSVALTETNFEAAKMTPNSLRVSFFKTEEQCN